MMNDESGISRGRRFSLSLGVRWLVGDVRRGRDLTYLTYLTYLTDRTNRAGLSRRTPRNTQFVSVDANSYFAALP